jgi:hypothetical protein
MPFLRDEQNRLIRKDGTLVPRAVGRRGPSKDRMSHLKVDRILGGPGALRTEYERLMDTPGVFLKDLQKFLADRGHRVCLTAVKIHRSRHQAEFKSLREAARMAEAFCRVAAENGGQGAFVDATQGRFEMLLMQDLFKLKDNPQLDPGEWQAWAKALGGAVAARRGVQALHEANERRTGTRDDAGKGGASGKDVVERMKEILGV